MVAHTDKDSSGGGVPILQEDAAERELIQLQQPNADLRDPGNDSTEVGRQEEEPPQSRQECQDNQQRERQPLTGGGGGDVAVEADFDVDDNCEMVMSFKCRHCSFLAPDKPTLATHIRHRHVGGSSGGKRHRHKSNHTVNASTQDVLEHVGFDVTKIKMNKKEIGKEEMPSIPSIPPTPEAFFIMSGDEEDDDSCQLLPLPATQSVDTVKKVVGSPRCNDNLHQDQDSSMDRDRDPMEMDDVFLCAECDIVFSSKELCCRHMHDVHGLEQFSAEFIQEVIISRRPGDDGENLMEEDNNGEILNEKSDKRITRKRIKPPKHLTLQEGALVPKIFRVSKTLTFLCSKCSMKYESEQVMKLHETCHIGQNDNNIPKRENGTKNGMRDWEEKGRSDEDEEDSLSAEEINQSLLEASSSTSTENRIKSGSEITQYKFKCPICVSDPTSNESQSNNKSVKEGPRDTKSKFFTKWSNCAGHLWREHQVDCELYSCTVCNTFKNYYITKVKDHEQLHKPESNYLCNICNKKFKQRHQLTTHQKYHKEKGTRLPPPSESRWYTPKECHICKRVLSDAKCLKKHISAVHKKLKPYCCNICGHMTARKAELRLHVRQHTNEKPYKCPHCPFVTGDHNSLRKHKLRHGNHRPYTCPYCEYRCIQSSAFKKHMVSIHPDQDVVFQCRICSHASVSESVASAHLNDHEEGRIPSSSRPPSSQDEDDSSNDRNDGPSREDGNTSSSSNDYPEIGIRSFGRRRPPLRKTKSPQKPRWLEQDDSVDVIDTGGVTIPAPAVVAPIGVRELHSSSSSLSLPSNNDKEPLGQSNPNSENVNIELNLMNPSGARPCEGLSTVNLDDIA